MPLTIAYPGTFDPLTTGHESVIRRASRIFDEVAVIVAEGVHKSTLFTLEERQEMIQEAISMQTNVTVIPLTGLLMVLLRQRGIKLILRGMRTVQDFEHEIQLASINRQLDRDVETLFMAPDNEFIHVASHFVREVSMLGGDISSYVSPAIELRLKDKHSRNGPA